MSLAFLSPSPMELMVIAVIALIVLGPARLPEAARSLGKGMREMRDSFQNADGDDDDDDAELEEDSEDHGAEEDLADLPSGDESPDPTGEPAPARDSGPAGGKPASAASPDRS